MASPSPKKSLSVRLDKDGKRTIHSKAQADNYKSVANFFFTIKNFVDFPDNFGRYSGYLLHVERKDGVKMEAFVTCEEMSVAKQFRNAINRTFSRKGGVLWESVYDNHLCTFLMSLTNEFWAAQNPPTRKAALVIGRQKAGDCYVFNQDVQVDCEGILIENENQQYVLMSPYLKNMTLAMNDKFIREYLTALPINIEVPLQSFNWKQFIEESRKFFNTNFFPYVMFLAGSLSVFHYQDVLKVVGSCSVPMAVGSPSSGKSTSLQIIQMLLGGKFISQTSGESLSAELVKTTVPVCWDDPTHPTTLKKVLVSTFQRGGRQTKQAGTELPETSFILTVNFRLDDDMRSFERTAPIWFEKIVEGASDFLEQKQFVFRLANTSCIPDVIRMVKGMDRDLVEHISFFHRHMHGLPNRLASIYSVYRFFATKVIDLVDDAVILSRIDLDDYLETRFIPYIKEYYGGSSLTEKNMDVFIGKIISAIESSPTNVTEVSKWLKPIVSSRNSVHGDTMHINLAMACNFLNNANFPTDINSVRALVAGISGASTNFRSRFVGTEGQISCAKVPRNIFATDVLNSLDKVLGATREPADEAETSNRVVDELRQKCQAKEDTLSTVRQELTDTEKILEAKINDLETKQEHYKEEIKHLKEQHSKDLESKNYELNHLKRKMEEACSEIDTTDMWTQTGSSDATLPAAAKSLSDIMLEASSSTSNPDVRLEDGLSQFYRTATERRIRKPRFL